MDLAESLADEEDLWEAAFDVPAASATEARPPSMIAAIECKDLEEDLVGASVSTAAEAEDEQDLDLELLVAVEEGSEMLVKELVEEGADPYILEDGRTTCLMIAAQCGHRKA